MAERQRQCGPTCSRYKRRVAKPSRHRQVQGELCAMRCGRVMVIVRVVANWPVSRDAVLVLSMQTHALRLWENVLPRVTAARPCTVRRCPTSLPPCENVTGQRWQLQHRCWQSLLLGNVLQVDRATMIQQQHQGRQQESACLLAAVAVDDRAGAIIHDVSVIRQRSWSSTLKRCSNNQCSFNNPS